MTQSHATIAPLTCHEYRIVQGGSPQPPQPHWQGPHLPPLAPLVDLSGGQVDRFPAPVYLEHTPAPGHQEDLDQMLSLHFNGGLALHNFIYQIFLQLKPRAPVVLPLGDHVWQVLHKPPEVVSCHHIRCTRDVATSDDDRLGALIWYGARIPINRPSADKSSSCHAHYTRLELEYLLSSSVIPDQLCIVPAPRPAQQHHASRDTPRHVLIPRMRQTPVSPCPMREYFAESFFC